jgi:hypothetical protein
LRTNQGEREQQGGIGWQRVKRVTLLHCPSRQLPGKMMPLVAAHPASIRQCRWTA